MHGAGIGELEVAHAVGVVGRDAVVIAHLVYLGGVVDLDDHAYIAVEHSFAEFSVIPCPEDIVVVLALHDLVALADGVIADLDGARGLRVDKSLQTVVKLICAEQAFAGR